MLYARMETSKTVFEAREKSVPLNGMFGTVYAPKSKLIEVEEVSVGAKEPHISFLVPYWVFWKNDCNPCQFPEVVEKIVERK